MEEVISRLELGPPPQTVEQLRQLQTEMPPLPEEPRAERAEPRRPVSLPVRISWQTSDGRLRVAPARTRDVTSTSVYLEVDPAARLSSPRPLLELEPGMELSLCASTRVVRVESKDGKIGIALVIEDYQFSVPEQGAEGNRRACAAGHGDD